MTKMGDRFFKYALLISLGVHVGTILYLSLDKLEILMKPLKHIEVTYQAIEQKKQVKTAEEAEPIKAVKQEEALKKIEILSKEPSDLPYMGEKLRDISKLSDKFRFGKKQIPKIKTVDMSRKITVPLIKSEKITNQKYLTYNESIRQKIRQYAYRHVNHPDFQQGEVYLTFVLASNGMLQDLQIVNARTQASNYLRTSSLRSIKESNPFPPFPSDLKYPELTFNVVISFEVNE